NEYLKGHSGDQLIVDRVSRPTVRVERPAITCAYTIQPDVIRGLAGQNAFRGRGLLGRFLYCFPPSWIGRRTIAPPSVPEDVREAYLITIESLAEICDGVKLELDSAAGVCLEAWEREVEAMLGEDGRLEHLRDWGGKLVGATIRIAGIIHVVERGVTCDIDEHTIASAIAIARYLIPHAETAISLMDAQYGEAAGDANRILRWIKRDGLTNFSLRDAHQACRPHIHLADDAAKAVDDLERRNFVRQLPNPPQVKGRPPSPRYEVNPATHELTRNERGVVATHGKPNSSRDWVTPNVSDDEPREPSTGEEGATLHPPEPSPSDSARDVAEERFTAPAEPAPPIVVANCDSLDDGELNGASTGGEWIEI
ncbi:MAG: DUF3987 domain-containing protein, partial [Planctomycetales bacterium]|nr:DUF3987 domain-containing protein [Planctomycetales bacterium]